MLAKVTVNAHCLSTASAKLINKKHSSYLVLNITNADEMTPHPCGELMDRKIKIH